MKMDCPIHCSLIVYKKGKYEVPMLQQEEKRPLPNSYSVALKRFNMPKQQLKGDPDLRKKYADTINTYIEKGFVKKLNREEACKVAEKTWYQLHRTMFNSCKPEKFQMDFYVAAEYSGNTLNKALLTGPDLLNSLVGVILQLHNYRVGFSANTEAMYDQV